MVLRLYRPSTLSASVAPESAGGSQILEKYQVIWIAMSSFFSSFSDPCISQSDCAGRSFVMWPCGAQIGV